MVCSPMEYNIKELYPLPLPKKDKELGSKSRKEKRNKGTFEDVEGVVSKIRSNKIKQM